LIDTVLLVASVIGIGASAAIYFQAFQMLRHRNNGKSQQLGIPPPPPEPDNNKGDFGQLAKELKKQFKEHEDK
jgi:hypothetical protein